MENWEDFPHPLAGEGDPEGVEGEDELEPRYARPLRPACAGHFPRKRGKKENCRLYSTRSASMCTTMATLAAVSPQLAAPIP
jgi:hypothetical protein